MPFKRDIERAFGPAWRTKAPGPWRDEPDTYKTAHRDYHLAFWRNTLGTWNAYVGLPVGHPFAGLHYDDVMERVDLPVYLTYAKHGYTCAGGPPFARRRWYVGFDFAHAGDVIPFMVLMRPALHAHDPLLRRLHEQVQEGPFIETYKTLWYAVERARQVADALDSVWER